MRIVVIIMVLLSTSCSHRQNVADVLSDAFTLANEGKYMDAQLKALEAEESLTDEASLADHEALARLYGLIYYQQNIRDDAKESLRQALDYAIKMNDTSLIIINHFNLGLCAITSKDAISNFEQAAALAQKIGDDFRQASALEKLAQVYISSNEFPKARQLLDEAMGLCVGNSTIQGEIAFTQCRLWLGEGKYDTALQGYISMNPDSLSVYGRLMRTNAIYDILIQKEDYKNALRYKDSVHLYTDSIKMLDGSKQVEEIETTYRANIDKKNIRFRILLWTSVVLIIVVLIILFFILKNLQLKQRQVELNNKITVLNSRIVELMPKYDDDQRRLTTTEEEVSSISHLIAQKYELSFEVFKILPEYGLLRKLNLIRDLSADNRIELKSVYDVIVGRFSGCCSDTGQAFPGMTKDDCVFCTMNFIGCSKEVISVAMGASEEALRRRKSRIKQKLPEETFLFFFSR